MHLVEETNDLSGNVLASGLLVVHDTSRGCEDNVSELTRWQELDNPLLEIGEADVVSWGDDTGLVQAVQRVSRSSSDRCDGSYRPFSWMTILPERWSSTSSNSPMYPRRMSVCCERLNV